MEEADIESAIDLVVKDMGKAAHDFKAKRYAPKPKAGVTEERESPEEKSAETEAPSLEQLESLLGK